MKYLVHGVLNITHTANTQSKEELIIQLPIQYQREAIASISIFAPLGKAATAKAERAGYGA